MIDFDKKELEKVFDAMIGEMLIDIENLILDEIKKKDLVYFGTLAKSVQVDFRNRELLIGAPYAQVVEFGSTKSFKLPYKPIDRWVKIKLGIRDAKKRRKITWAIIQTFAKKGYKPHPYVIPAIKNFISRINNP